MLKSKLRIPGILTLIALLMLSMPAFSGDDIETFSQERFEELQKEDAVILVDVWASWCSTCRAQSEVLESLLSEEEFESVHKLRIDWDDQKSIAEGLNAWRQSTLIVYKGENEMARVVAETREEALRNFLQAGI